MRERPGEECASRSRPATPAVHLIVAIGPGAPPRSRSGARPTTQAGVVACRLFRTAPGEAFHGFGGRHNALDQRGNDFYSWVEQQNIGAGLARAADRRRCPAAAASLPVPQRPDRRLLPAVAVHLLARLRVPARPPRALRLADGVGPRRRLAGHAPRRQRLDYIVAPGEPRRAIRKLTAITGRHRAAAALGARTRSSTG